MELGNALRISGGLLVTGNKDAAKIYGIARKEGSMREQGFLCAEGRLSGE